MVLNNNNMRSLGFSYTRMWDVEGLGEEPKMIGILLREDRGSNTTREGLEKTEKL